MKRGVVVLFFVLISYIAAAAQVPETILSPVRGRLEYSLQSHYAWAAYHYPQPGGFHIVGGGIRQSDDRHAYDFNLNYPIQNFDRGEPVYSVDYGVVVSYADAGIVGSYGCVLIEHYDYATASTWWSGYLHLSDIRVAIGDYVSPDSVIGRVSSVSQYQIPDHLHFVAYSGSNVPDGLVSEEVTFVGRDDHANDWQFDQATYLGDFSRIREYNFRRFDYAGDSDVFELDVDERGRYTIETHGADTVLFLADSEGNTVLSNDDKSDSDRGSKISFRTQGYTDRRVYVIVYHYDSYVGVGPYSLSFRKSGP